MTRQFLNGRWIAHRAWHAVLLVGFGLSSGPGAVGAESAAESVGQPPMIPVGLDAYRQWDRWPYQRIGARAYMRKAYDHAGGNETADASHFLYQLAEDLHGSRWRVRVDFTPFAIPLLPDQDCGDLAWSEIRYQAYCYVMPEIG